MVEHPPIRRTRLFPAAKRQMRTEGPRLRRRPPPGDAPRHLLLKRAQFSLSRLGAHPERARSAAKGKHAETAEDDVERIERDRRCARRHNRAARHLADLAEE